MPLAIAAEECLGWHGHRGRQRTDTQADGRRDAEIAGAACRRDALGEGFDRGGRRPGTEQTLQDVAQTVDAPMRREPIEVRKLELAKLIGAPAPACKLDG